LTSLLKSFIPQLTHSFKTICYKVILPETFSFKMSYKKMHYYLLFACLERYKRIIKYKKINNWMSVLC
jgi:hypothetical protein